MRTRSLLALVGLAISFAFPAFAQQQKLLKELIVDTSPRIPVGQAIAYWSTYTIDEAAKTFTDHIERCTFPQWDGGGGTNIIEFPTEDEFHFTVPKPFPDPTLGPIAPHLIFKRAPVP
jgi:hypothetical protein